jgi:pyruvate kinase
MSRRTKIVATLGPACDDPDVLRNLLRAGVDVVRLNLSHGELDEHLDRLAQVRRAAQEIGKQVAVLADLPGPKIRTGRFPEGGVQLTPGSLVNLRPGDGPSDARCITVPYPTLLDDLVVGSRVQLGDGAISMTCVAIDADGASALIETGGHANGQPGVHLSSETLRLTTPTPEDLVLADTMAAVGVEYIAVSFVRKASDVEEVRAIVGVRAQLVAKIETHTAIDNLRDIVIASDAIMVARGDLGIDCPIEDVPHLQKRVIRHCVESGTPVITATQMLESMITAPSPTRAEVSDIANAVFDGTDAVMLSGETAIGRDPIGVVRTMARVAERAESEASYRQWATRLGRAQRSDDHLELASIDRITGAVTHAAWQASIDAEANAILCCTRSGRTARAMARFRPQARMIGLSPDPSMVRSMALIWGVDPVQVDTYATTDEMVWFAVETALGHQLIAHGDTVLVLAGAPAGGRNFGRGGNAIHDGLFDAVEAATDVMRVVHVE